MLSSIYLSRLHNSEFIQFFDNLVVILRKRNPEELLIKEQLQPIETTLEKTRAVQSTEQSSEISTELKTLDDLRDDCINGIEKVLDGYSYHYDLETRRAAKTLLYKIENYGPTIARQNYPAETASITGITKAFTTEEKYIAALAKLSLTTWAEKLKEDNDRFNQRYLDRVDENARKNDDAIKELRQEITTDYYQLRDHLNAHYTLNKVRYTPVIDLLNELIEKYNSIIKHRSNSNDNGEKQMV